VTASASAGADTSSRTAVVTLAAGVQSGGAGCQIARLPTGLEFVEAFGDLRLILVYGVPGVSVTRAVRAVTATLAGEDGNSSDGLVPGSMPEVDGCERAAVS